ncbi:MAG TPA: hypothetical protein DEQ84_00795 [Prevotellaceae bacterium]|nr:hypothetical protein [Prevotellaceae bacterium]
MKTIYKMFILLCAVGVLSSCEAPVENMKYVRNYTYNYFVTNGLTNEVVCEYSAISKSKKYNHIKKTFAISPSYSVPIDQQIQTRGADTKQSIPVLTSENQAEYILYDYKNRRKYDDPYITIETNGMVYESYDLQNAILLTKNYRSETLNDTTFNFYFTIDDAYLSTLRVEE